MLSNAAVGPDVMFVSDLKTLGLATVMKWRKRFQPGRADVFKVSMFLSTIVCLKS
jgi:hypothetical protein